MGLLSKIKERFNKNIPKKVFLLVSWDNATPQVLKHSTNSNTLYKLLDFDKHQDVLTLEEYETIVQNQN